LLFFLFSFVFGGREAYKYYCFEGAENTVLLAVLLIIHRLVFNRKAVLRKQNKTRNIIKPVFVVFFVFFCFWRTRSVQILFFLGVVVSLILFVIRIKIKKKLG